MHSLEIHLNQRHRVRTIQLAYILEYNLEKEKTKLATINEFNGNVPEAIYEARVNNNVVERKSKKGQEKDRFTERMFNRGNLPYSHGRYRRTLSVP